MEGAKGAREVWLVYGGRGWIGSLFCEGVVSKEESPRVTVVYAKSRADNYEDVVQEVREIGPTWVLSFVGRTSGPAISKDPKDTDNNTIDWLEKPGNLVYNLRDNLVAPLILEKVCREEGCLFMYIGTGCIYTYGDSDPEAHLFTEDDKPNFTGSHYSTVKGATDQLLRLSPITLNIRLRMPIVATPDRKNLLTKLLSYTSIANSVNSVSVLPDLLPILYDLLLKKRTGTYHLVNPGSISHHQILALYKEYVDPSFTWVEEPEEVVGARLRAARSRCILDASTIISEYNPPTAIESITKIWKNWKA